MITATDPTLCTKAPSIGFKIPVIANIIATKLRSIERIALPFPNVNLIIPIIYLISKLLKLQM